MRVWRSARASNGGDGVADIPVEIVPSAVELLWKSLWEAGGDVEESAVELVSQAVREKPRPSAICCQCCALNVAVAVWTAGRRASVAARAVTSRGPAESRATRPRRRSRSRTPDIALRRASRWGR